MINEAIASEIQSLSPSSRIELFEVDLSMLGDVIYRFHAGTNDLMQPIVWQGETYDPWPCEASGFELTTNGQMPRPKLTLANLTGALTALALAFGDCVGAKVTRKLTLLKFLDAVNFDGGNPTADPNAYFPDEIYFVDRKSAETFEIIEFELTAAFDVTGVKLPRRQIIQGVCPWRYRGAECGYTGRPVSDSLDKLFTTSDSSNQAEQDVIILSQDLSDAKTDLNTKKTAMTKAYNTMLSKEKFVLLDEKLEYNPPAYGGVPPDTSYIAIYPGGNVFQYAYYNGVDVDLGQTYRKGKTPIQVSGTENEIWPIQKWGQDTDAYNDSVTAYNTAETQYNTALSVYNGLKSSYETAIENLPSNSNLYKLDVCGKRLSSCKLRFGENGQLPFGGFPGAGLK